MSADDVTEKERRREVSRIGIWYNAFLSASGLARRPANGKS
jgi:hypothetical protein